MMHLFLALLNLRMQLKKGRREKCILILLYSVEDSTEERARRGMPFILLKWSGASIFTDEYIRSITSPHKPLWEISHRAPICVLICRIHPHRRVHCCGGGGLRPSGRHENELLEKPANEKRNEGQKSYLRDRFLRETRSFLSKNGRVRSGARNIS